MDEASGIICPPTMWYPNDSGKNREAKDQKIEVFGRLGSDDDKGDEKTNDGDETHE